MTEIPGLDSRRYSKYSSVSDETKARYKGFEKIKEYEHFYLCGRYADDGRLLYKECFSKFDVDRHTRRSYKDGRIASHYLGR